MRFFKYTAIFALCVLLLCLVSCRDDSANGSEEVIYYTVTLDTQGGEEMSPLSVIKDGLIPEPTTPVRDGFIFKQWEYNDTEWFFDDHTVKSDMTLTAV